MTSSQKTLKKIIIYSLLIGTILTVLAYTTQYIVGGDGGLLTVIFAVPAGMCAIVLVLTFVAFLASLVISSSKEK